jgi:guanosine-3',5'-bis(diphosphate) 3'-pyrophosphohydrolase
VRSESATTLLLDALHFAADKHRFQRRKDPAASPYINHPIAAADLLARVGGVTDLVTLLAALLHDTLEDTETTSAELDERYGTEVRAVVEEVTDDKTLPKEERKRRQVEHAPHLSQRAKLVKIADKICNVLDVTHHPPAKWTRDRRLEYLDWSAAVVQGCKGANPALERYFAEVLAQGRALLGGR